MSLMVIIPPSATPVVTVNSTGAGNRNTSAGSPVTTTFTHTVVDGESRRMYAFMAISHNNWLNSYSSTTASSDIDGDFTLIAGPVLFGNASGYKQGAVVLFELINPSIGTHTITLRATASQWLNMIGGNTRCYNNVGGYDTAVTQAQTTTNGALSVSVLSAEGDMALLVSAFSANPTLSGGMPSPWYSAGSSINGDADYMVAMDRLSEGGSYGFTSSSSSHKVGAIGINLTKS